MTNVISCLFVTDVVRMHGGWLLHGDEAQNLQQVVLHHVTDDAEFVKVAASALSAERLLEGDENGGDVVSVPGGIENAIAESESNFYHKYKFKMNNLIDCNLQYN